MNKKTLSAILLAVLMAITAYLAFSTMAVADEDAFGVSFDDDM